MALSGQCLGILAGNGQLPLEVAAEVRRQGQRVHIVGIVGEADKSIEQHDHTWIGWGQIGAMLRAFRRAGCRDVLIIGSVRRPDLRAVRPDLGFFVNLPLILSLKRGGDDSVLRRVVGFFEKRGFAVRGVQDVAPHLLADVGALGTTQPQEGDKPDIAVGFQLLDALAQFDVGQAVVIAGGRPVAIEAAEGTDAMLRRLAALRDAGHGGAGGVLVKAPKRGQELRVDMPAIGPRTADLAAAAGLRGIAVAAGRVLVAEREELRRASDQRNLFVYGAGAAELCQAPTFPIAPVVLSARMLTGGPVPPGQQDDIERALGVATAASRFGAGDGVVVIRGHVLAVGAEESAEAVLERSALVKQWGDGRRNRRRRGVLAVRSEPTEAIVTKAAQAGLAGLVTSAATCDPTNLSAALEAARRHGLLLARAGGNWDEGRGSMLTALDHVAPPQPTRPGAGSQEGTARPLRLFLVAGEHSGDALGAKLMAAIKARLGALVTFEGVGGEQMEAQGLDSLFPLADVAVMGPLSILPRLPRIVRRVYAAVDAAIAAKPDLVVIIDSPEFTHPIAKRIRKRCPHIPIIDYVSPSVWAWRPGRARKMRPYVDHVLGLLPFEPEAHARLGGPPCTYVGHPLIEKVEWMHGLDEQALARRLELERNRPVLTVLPGSRSSEVERLMEPFGKAITRLQEQGANPEVIIPALPHVRGQIERAIQSWPLEPHLVEGEEDKYCAFKLATVALAASGTVTLELALAGTPMVVAYRVDALAARLRFLVKVPSVVLANLVLGENVFPEFIQEDCMGENLAGALLPLFSSTHERAQQVAGLACIPKRLQLPQGSPSDAAAEVVLTYAARLWEQAALARA